MEAFCYQSMEAFVTKLLALRLSLPVRYGLATLLIGAVTGIRLLLADFLASYPYLLYFPVVIICALVLEHGTSLYATFLCGFLAVFMFVEPRHQLATRSRDHRRYRSADAVFGDGFRHERHH